MNQEQFAERMKGIISHENQKMLGYFPGVASYTSYKQKSLFTVQKVFELLYQPYVLKGFYESIAADQPYFPALHMFPLSSDWGKRVNSFNLKNSENTLEAAHAISGGSIKWTKYVDGETVTLFVWVDPEVIQASSVSLEKELIRTSIVTDDSEADDLPEENEVPQYN